MKDKRIDSYIKKSLPFAQPILTKMRELVHKACPGVTETIKWGMPAFEYKGPMCGMASFKEHCVFGFWKGPLLDDPNNHLRRRATHGGDAMGNLGKITSLKDLPPDKMMIAFIKQAMKLNDEGIRIDKKKTTIRDVVIPDIFNKALSKNKKAKSVFDNFSLSAQREYCEWIADAKTEATQQKRITEALQWISEGKKRNWKYDKAK